MKFLFAFSFILISFISNSQSWQDVGGGSNNSSHAMLVWNGQLVNLGSYNNPCQRVSIWNGTSWQCLSGGGVGIVARAGCIWNGNLVVVGDFWNNFQPCNGCNGVAMWDGTQWTAFDDGFNNDVLTCTVWNGELIIGGDFTQANGVPVSRVVRWDVATSTFISMGAPTDFGNDVRCMTEYNGDLWVGGDFNNVGGCSPCDGLVKWDVGTSTWTGGNSGVDLVGGVNESVRVLYVNPNDGNLYMGGEFPELHDGDAAAQNFDMSGIAMYDGSNWFSLGTGLNEYCRAINEYNGNLIAGGYFTSAGGVPANKIAKWTPGTSTWSAMGQGFDGVGLDEYVKSAMVWNGIFFAGGAYTQAEGGPMNYIAQWYEPVVNPPVAVINNSSATECAGSCINFTDNSSNLPTTWSWQFPGSNTPTSTDQNPGSICFAAGGSYTVHLTVCNANGCNTTSVNITIEDIPTLTVNDQTICDGSSATITATPSAGGGTYNWISGGEVTDNIVVSPNSTTSYAVEYTLNGCTSTIETGIVTVNPIPTVTVTGSNSICEGDNVSLTATPSTNGGTYAWIPNGETSSNINDSPVITTNYSVIYTLSGCASPSVNLNVIVNSIYNSSVSQNICEGNTIIYPDGNSEVIINNTTHTSNLTTTTGCDSIITTNVTMNNNYSLTETFTFCEGENHTYPDGTTSSNLAGDESHISNLQSILGCDSIITTNLTVNPNPDNTVTESSNVLTSNQDGGFYQWIDCDDLNAPIQNETNQTYSPINNGSYAVEVSLNGCNSISDCISISTIGLNKSEFSFKVYPNPVINIINIESNLAFEGYTYKVFDTQGRVVYQGVLEANGQIDVNTLSTGTYVLKLNETHYIRFVKQ